MTHAPVAAHGREYLAIPGPSVIPDAVLQAMHAPAPNIYSGPLVDTTRSIVRDLCRIARTDGHVAMYIGNGHAAWEAALANVVAPDERILVLSTGRFAQGWGEMAKALGAQVDVIDFGTRSPIDPARVSEALTQDAGHTYKAVLTVHVDTSTSVLNDIAAVRHAIDAARHPALFMVDCIASLACDRFEMDAWGVDIMVAGCQKGLMVPPGVAFVFFNDKAAAVRDAMPRVSRYWDWAPRVEPEEFYAYWCGTAPTHHLFGLRKALDLISAEGLENVYARHERLATAIWTACEVWGQGGPLEMNIADRAHRSRAVSALRLGAPNGTALRDWVASNLNLTLGIGLGMAPPGDPAWHGFFRLGHMGHLSGHMVMGMLGGIEAGLEHIGVPRGPGALEAAAKVIGKTSA